LEISTAGVATQPVRTKSGASAARKNAFLSFIFISSFYKCPTVAMKLVATETDSTTSRNNFLAHLANNPRHAGLATALKFKLWVNVREITK
jgi:hypothetical protein